MDGYFPLLGNKLLKRDADVGHGQGTGSPKRCLWVLVAAGTLSLFVGAPICSSCGRSFGLSSFRYHHCISKDMGAELRALKAQGISTSSPSPTLTSLGTSVNDALVELHEEEHSNTRKDISWECGS